jgi:hypothetical protein
MTKKSFNWRKVVAIVTCLAVTCMMFLGCKKDDPNITIANEQDLTQTAWADEETTGNGCTFTAKNNWTASVMELNTNKGSDVSWITLLCNGVETYSGSAGTFTIVISIEKNTTGQIRTATIEIKCGSDKITITVVQEGKNKDGETPAKDPIELKSPIRENTTLKNLGLDVDYFYAGNNQLIVENNATLTIEPGVTIKFTHTGRGGGINIKANSTIKAIGTSSKQIQFIGMNNEKGSWDGIKIESNTDNQFAYCNFTNMGNMERIDYGGLHLYNAKAGFSHCKMSGGLGTGLYVNSQTSSLCQLTTFDNNIFEGYENYPPVVILSTGSLKVLEKFDITSNFTKNAKPYIEVNPELRENVTINQTTVPYFFRGPLPLIDYTLTFNEGVTVYMDDNGQLGGSQLSKGRIMVNGTSSKKVKFTRLPGTSNYWNYISFEALSGSVVNYCILEYGGRTQTRDAMIIITKNTNLTLSNVEINNAQNYGVHILNCDYNLEHNSVTFSDNKSGNIWVGINALKPDCDNSSAVVLEQFP